MLQVSNEEIRQKLLKLNYKCGPVTDTTREIHLKKLEELSAKSPDNGAENLTDDQLRSQLMALGEVVAPITSTNRNIYIKRLAKLKKCSKNLGPDNETNELEPMDVD